MGYLYLGLAVFASSTLGVMYKISDRLKCDKAQVNFYLFLSAAVIAVIWNLVNGKIQGGVFPVALGATMGLVAFVNIMSFRLAVSKGKISTSWTICNLSLVIPVAASIIFWHEVPTIKHCVGLALVVIAILLLGKDIRCSEN